MAPVLPHPSEPEAVNNNPHLPPMLSIPHVFITLLFFYFISPAHALQALGRQAIPMSDLCLSGRSRAPRMDRHPICRNRCSPLTRWMRVVSAAIEINRSSCPANKTVACLLLDGPFLRGDNSSVGLVMKEPTAGGHTASPLARRSKFTELSSFQEA